MMIVLIFGLVEVELLDVLWTDGWQEQFTEDPCRKERERERDIYIYIYIYREREASLIR